MLPIRPVSFAVTSLGIWATQLVLCVLLWLLFGERERLSIVLFTLSLAANVLLGVALSVLLLRALRWRPRRKKRDGATREVRRERQRIARELHDNVGSQIVNAMILLDSPATARQPVMHALEQCMLDLRLLVELMSESNDSLIEYLANLRHRVQPVLDSRHIELEWDVDASAEANVPKGARAKELCRVVQEAVSNILQHAHAKRICITLRPYPEMGAELWLLSVADNGVGLPKMDMPGMGGRGLLHMQKRAMRAGGVLSFEAVPGGGTEVRVVMPGSEVEQIVSGSAPLARE